jgi:cytochrome b561
MNQYSKRTAVLHWLVFVLLAAALFLGYELGDSKDTLRKLTLYPAHFMMGIMALLLNLARMSYRDSDGQPAPANDTPLLNKIAAATHRLLNLSIVAVVITGAVTLAIMWVSSALQQNDPALAGNLEKIDARQFHDLFIWLLILLVAFHIIAALYHQLVLGDNILRRIAIKRFPDK